MRPELRREFGQASRSRYELHFTFERMAANTLALYEQVLDLNAANIAVAAGSF
jgi:hypothetical protein